MRVGIDFPSLFDSDNFTIRRASQIGAGNWYDPESLITGTEIARGLTPSNSTRNYRNEAHYHASVSQALTPEQIALTAPRIRKVDQSGLTYECPALERYWEAQRVA